MVEAHSTHTIAKIVYDSSTESIKVLATVSGTSDVNVVNTPDVNVANTPDVSVTNTPDVSVTNTPTVDWDSDQAVVIKDTDANGGNTVKVAGDSIFVRDCHASRSFGVTSVGLSDTEIISSTGEDRNSGVLLCNRGDSVVYIGYDSPTVTVANGTPLFPREKLTIPTTGAIHGITEDTAGVDVSYLEV
jgi:hypothetical protein